MNNKPTKFLVLFLVFSVTFAGLMIYPQKRAHALDVEEIIIGGAGIIAACTAYSYTQDKMGQLLDWAKSQLPGLDDLFGEAVDAVNPTGNVPVFDRQVMDAQNQTISSQVKNDDFRSCVNLVKEYVLTNIKKQLLNEITNETVKWIQGEGEPRFIDDPSGFFGSAANDALGKTVQDLGLSEMCTGLNANVRVRMQTTRFRDRVTCTLDDVVENVESFANDFRNGGWLAYNESLKMQNNPLGANILTEQKLRQEQLRRERENEFKAEAGQGFVDQVICRRWQIVNDSGELVTRNSNESPELKTQDPFGVPFHGKSDMPGEWLCTQKETITPGQTIAQSTERALASDIDFLVNADDLTSVTVAIVDALVSRLAREATGGLKNLIEEGGERDGFRDNPESNRESDFDSGPPDNSGGEGETEPPGEGEGPREDEGGEIPE